MRRRFVLLLLVAIPLALVGLSRPPTAPDTAWFTPDATTVEECPAERIDCLRQALANLAYRDGGREALARLSALAIPGSALERDCHGVVHAIGGAVYARQLEIGPAFTEGGSECGYGFYHGVVEQAFSREGIDPAKAARACAALADMNERDQCSHGAGHAFGSQGSPAEAAARCESFADADPSVSRGSCYAGAFMEGFVGALGPPRWSEGASACDALPDSIRPTCYGQAAIARLSDPDRGGWAYAAEGCAGLGASDRDGCVEGWSSQLAGKEGWAEICALAGDADEVCAVTIGEMEAVFRMPDPTLAIGACEREFAADARLVVACARGVGRRVEPPQCASFTDPVSADACRRARGG